MDADFARVFAITVGAIVGLPTIALVGRATLGIGRKWGDMEAVQAATSMVANETRDAIYKLTDAVNPRLARIEFILCGPDGENGLRSDVRDVRDRVGVIEQRVGSADRRKTPRVVKNDRRRKA